ncbi:MAG: response regulator transcription factor [Actinomycetota bacterium]
MADDSEDLRYLYRMQLTTAGGFEVVGEAADGPTALAICIDKQPDVLILDLHMPPDGVSSYIPKIRKASPKTRVIVVSGSLDVAVHSDVLSLGAHQFVDKQDVAGMLGLIVQRSMQDA